VDQLDLLGIKDVSPANLPALIDAIKDTAEDGTGVDTVKEIEDLLKAVLAQNADD
jgi:hypothetical protein